jgi:hypothetical protein
MYNLYLTSKSNSGIAMGVAVQLLETSASDRPSFIIAYA